MHSAIFVTNQRSSYRVVQGAAALNQTISSSTIAAALDANLKNIHADTEVMLVQVKNNDVMFSLHGEDPSSTTAIVLVAGTIAEMSRSQWLASKWLRVSADVVLVALQLRGS